MEPHAAPRTPARPAGKAVPSSTKSATKAGGSKAAGRPTGASSNAAKAPPKVKSPAGTSLDGGFPSSSSSVDRAPSQSSSVVAKAPARAPARAAPRATGQRYEEDGGAASSAAADDGFGGGGAARMTAAPKSGARKASFTEALGDGLEEWERPKAPSATAEGKEGPAADGTYADDASLLAAQLGNVTGNVGTGTSAVAAGPRGMAGESASKSAFRRALKDEFEQWEKAKDPEDGGGDAASGGGAAVEEMGAARDEVIAAKLGNAGAGALRKHQSMRAPAGLVVVGGGGSSKKLSAFKLMSLRVSARMCACRS